MGIHCGSEDVLVRIDFLAHVMTSEGALSSPLEICKHHKRDRVFSVAYQVIAKEQRSSSDSEKYEFEIDCLQEAPSSG